MKSIFRILLTLGLLIGSASVAFAKDDVCGPQAPTGGSVTVLVTGTAKTVPSKNSAFGLGKDIPAGTNLPFSEVACDGGVTFLKVNWDDKELWLPNTWPTFGTVWGTVATTPTTTTGSTRSRCTNYSTAVAGKPSVAVSVGCLNIRSGAGMSNAVIGKASRGSRFEWVSTDSDIGWGWYQVRLALNTIGWVSFGPQNSYSQVQN